MIFYVCVAWNFGTFSVCLFLRLSLKGVLLERFLFPSVRDLGALEQGTLSIKFSAEVFFGSSGQCK